MSKTLDISDNDATKHQAKLAQQLFDNRNTVESTCDLVLISNGKKFPVHKSVLMTYSNYFKAMFTVEMKEKYEHEINNQHILPERLVKIIDYMYTGKIYVDEECMCDVFEDAEYLQLEDLKLRCSKFIISVVTPGNCLKLKVFGQKHNLEDLVEVCEKKISTNFTDVMQSDAFMQFDHRDIVDLIKRKNKIVNSEEAAFSGIVQWVNHDSQHREELFGRLIGLLDLSSMSSMFLSEIAKQKLLSSHPACLKVLIDAYVSVTTYSDSGKFLLIGGDNGPTDCTKYDVLTGEFRHMPKLPTSLFERSSVRAERNIYVIGGAKQQQGENTHRTCEMLNLNQPTEWKTLSLMLRSRCHCGAAFDNGYIYITGGFDRGSIAYCEKFDIAINRWMNIPSMLHKRYGHGSVVYQGSLYCIGGEGPEQVHLNSCEVYNTLNERWREIAPLNQARMYTKCVVLDGLIYAVGGMNEDGAAMDTVERYTPETDKWEFVAPLNHARWAHSVCVVGGKIYVIGGDVKSVESYDVTSNVWSKCFKTVEVAQFATAVSV